MPPPAPLANPVQDLGRPFSDRAAPAAGHALGARGWRLAVFGPAGMATAVLMWLVLSWFAADGTTWAEAVLAALMGVGVFWIALTFATVLAGAAAMLRRRAPEAGTPSALDVALLVPIYEEAPWDVFGNAAAMLEALARAAGDHAYALYILSDTRDPARAAQEEAAFDTLRAVLPEARIWYRRRPGNTDRKVGNLRQWVQGWGAAHDAMLVLDADSLMSARAIGALVDALARDPGAGLIQSFPQLIGAQSLFARSQQFANAVYGVALAEGLALWTGREGNYWGHNAILRTAAFAASAGLPRTGGDRLILSHDFVEAGLLRRAGWGVRFLPRVQGSFEETPPSLVDHVLRDRRWCRGNLQHLGLLRTKGFHALSRFHLFHGAVGYLLSPLWLVLLALWVGIGASEEASVIRYFHPSSPLQPTWPEMTPGHHAWLMAALYGLLLAPKLVGGAALLLSGVPLSRLGGGARFAGSVAAEVALSIAYAPILMIQQSLAVGAAVLGRPLDWAPQSRSGGRYGWTQLARFHWVETALGTALAAGMAAGVVSVWLTPVMASLLLAVPLSALSARPSGWLMATPQEVRAPHVARRAARWRAVFRARLGGVPAE